MTAGNEAAHGASSACAKAASPSCTHTVEVLRAQASTCVPVLPQAGHAHWPQLHPVWGRLLRQADGATLCNAVGGAERVVRVLAAGPLGASGAAQVGAAVLALGRVGWGPW